MSLGLAPGLIRRFLAMSADDQRSLLADLSPAVLLSLDADFEVWANDGQRYPPGEGWRVWLMMAGRGYGKTRAGAEWVHGLARNRGVRIALVGASIDEARSIMVEGASGIMSVARSRRVTVKWEPSVKRLTWPNGSVAELYSGDHADGLRGPEHGFAWCIAARRLPAVPGGRGAAAPGAARHPCVRAGLYHCQRRDRCVGRP